MIAGITATDAEQVPGQRSRGRDVTRVAFRAREQARSSHEECNDPLATSCASFSRRNLSALRTCRLDIRVARLPIDITTHRLFASMLFATIRQRRPAAMRSHVDDVHAAPTRVTAAARAPETHLMRRAPQRAAQIESPPRDGGERIARVRCDLRNALAALNMLSEA